MKEEMMKRLACLTLIILCALSVSACGLRGNLERPPPLWGHPAGYEEPAEDGAAADTPEPDAG
jgi:predicted small lipoprotein YifL